jgi:hypothetical protein
MPAGDPAQLPPPTMWARTHSQAGILSVALQFSSDAKTPALTSPMDVLLQIIHASLSPAGIYHDAVLPIPLPFQAGHSGA